jgi:hypothetical protein
MLDSMSLLGSRVRESLAAAWLYAAWNPHPGSHAGESVFGFSPRKASIYKSSASCIEFGERRDRFGNCLWFKGQVALDRCRPAGSNRVNIFKLRSDSDPKSGYATKFNITSFPRQLVVLKVSCSSYKIVLFKCQKECWDTYTPKDVQNLHLFGSVLDGLMSFRSAADSELDCVDN